MRSVGTANLDMVADRIVARGSTVGKADVLAVLYLLIEVVIDSILEGWCVSLGGLVRLCGQVDPLGKRGRAMSASATATTTTLQSIARRARLASVAQEPFI